MLVANIRPSVWLLRGSFESARSIAALLLATNTCCRDGSANRCDAPTKRTEMRSARLRH